MSQEAEFIEEPEFAFEDDDYLNSDIKLSN